MRKTVKGQITIFMALIFMVIFTLFTMTVSLSMFIHDKINLQNATDLASYYVASKQAELLGAMAHNNYIIRQSFKLMTYRYRVYGNGGRTDTNVRHPGNQAGWSSFYGNQSPYVAAIPTANSPPRICVGSAHLFNDIVIGSTDNPCRRLDFSVGYVNTVTSIVGSLVGGINAGVVAANELVQNSCESIAYTNWWYANMIVGAHRFEQRDRRVIIDALAENLARPIISGDDGMKDIEGGNIYDGAFRTFNFNLTESNKEDLESGNAQREEQLTITNSMVGVTPDQWISPVLVNLLIPYSHYETGGSGCSEAAFNNSNTGPVSNLTTPGVGRLKSMLDPQDQMASFGSTSGTRADPYENISIGVEKNPWYMVYNKTEARVFSKPLFLGGYINQRGLQMVALSYAKPFGGRIGPWNQKVWPSGSPESATGDRTDPLAPNRVTLSEYGTNIDQSDPTLYPNYSRFPSDQAGLTTNEAMVHAGPIVGWSFTSISSSFRPPTSLKDYALTTYSFFTGDYSDPLAQDVDSAQPENSFNRRLELAAIMPDAFDYTYYSISPNYYDYFIESPDGQPKLSSWLTLPTNVELRGDLGASPNNPRFSILDQMFINDEVQAIDASLPGVTFNISRGRDQIPYFFTDNPLALLTSWNKGQDPMSYDTPTSSDMDDFFATCSTAFRGNASLNDKPRVPSGCLRGGRFGYSVKLISADYINSEHPIGGNGTTGSIVNPR